MTVQLNIVARIAPRPEYREQAIAAICAIVKETRAESGCIAFKVNECQVSRDIILYEEWRDEAAFEFHHSQIYTLAVMKAYADWLLKDPEIVRLNPVV
jgi:quinol monooxygenase YgiN